MPRKPESIGSITLQSIKKLKRRKRVFQINSCLNINHFFKIKELLNQFTRKIYPMIDGFSRLFHKPSSLPAPTPPEAKNNSTNMNVALAALAGLTVFNTAVLAYILSQKNAIPWIGQNRRLNEFHDRLNNTSDAVDLVGSEQRELKDIVSGLKDRVEINEELIVNIKLDQNNHSPP
jgi:hypothetical protein